MENVDEKRRYARLQLRSKINFSILETFEKEESPLNRFRGVGKNIGVEGVLFTSDTKLEPGTALELEIYLPDKADPVYIKGEVRWCKLYKKDETGKDAFDVGVKFLTIDKSHVLLLIKYLCGTLGDEYRSLG